MFQYYDSIRREYIDFNDDTNKLLSNSTHLLVYKHNGDSHIIYDLSEMTEYDIIHKVKRKIRKV